VSVPALRLDVLSLMPVLYKQCSRCETMYNQAGIAERVQNEMLREYPADVLDDHARLSDWVHALAARYGDALTIHVIDPHSLPGLWKALRHRVRGYPTFIVAGKEKYTGWDRGALERLIRRHIQEA